MDVNNQQLVLLQLRELERLAAADSMSSSKADEKSSAAPRRTLAEQVVSGCVCM